MLNGQNLPAPTESSDSATPPYIAVATGYDVDRIGFLFAIFRNPGETDVELRERIRAAQHLRSPRFYERKRGCECGSEKARTPGHSTWCPKYEE